MKNLRKNENGSTILWTMLISMVLLVIVAATLSISYAYSHRSLNGNDQKQAYFTARSAVNMVVNEFSSNSPDAQVIVTYLMDSRSWHTDDVGFSKS